jgi:hypothetical protein
MHRQGRKAPMIWIWAMLALACLPARAAPLPDATQFRVQMEAGAVERAREWLDAGLAPDFLGDRIGSGLMIAAWEGNLPLMELFHARGANIDQTNARGETALMHAAWKGHGAAVRWLLEHGARVGQQPEQWTALHYAVFAGHGEIAERLLEAGADINARSPNRSSVLMMAVYGGREDLARWLLVRGADTRIRNENGQGALDWAMKFNQTKIARMVATQEEFRVAASRPKADWGEVRKSEPMPKEIEELLVIREALASRNFPLDVVDQNIAAARARHARAAMKREAPPPAVLEISASRRAPDRQSARIIDGSAPAK